MTTNMKEGDTVTTWHGNTAIIKRIETNKKLKPVVVEIDGKEQYFHFNQIKTN